MTSHDQKIKAYSVSDELRVFYAMNDGFAFLIALTKTSQDIDKYREVFQKHAPIHFVDLGENNAWSRFASDMTNNNIGSSTTLLNMVSLDSHGLSKHLALLNRGRSQLEKNLSAPLCILVDKQSAHEIVTYCPDMFSIRESIFNPIFCD